jgi:transcriptional regulator GlxA family with amidase domain
MHSVAILALDGVIPFDLSVPIEVFGRACTLDGRAAYEVYLCAPNDKIDTGTFKLLASHGLDMLIKAETIMLPGVTDTTAPIPDNVLATLQSAAARGARIASICTGAFILAATGLLDGLRATTHWRATSELAERYPAIDVDANILFVDNGHILTSAGAAAGLDLCLYMIRQDYGAVVAANTARVSVMPLERDGGQAQFIMHEPPVPDGVTLEPVLRWLEANLQQDIKLEDIAAQAMMSTRTLSRRFREQTGTTPRQWLNRARVYKAQYLLESTKHSIEYIASTVGFGSSTTLRDQFKDLVGVSPQAYRRTFQK